MCLHLLSLLFGKDKERELQRYRVLLFHGIVVLCYVRCMYDMCVKWIGIDLLLVVYVSASSMREQ